MRFALVLGFATACAGCAGVAGIMGAHVNAYPGVERPITEVAVLLNPGGAMPAKVDGKHVGDNTFGYPSDVRVLPGERRITIDCMGARFRVTPTVLTANFVAGHFYHLQCHDQGDGKYAGDVQDLGTTDPRGKP
jgi:hypothetical protein